SLSLHIYIYMNNSNNQLIPPFRFSIAEESLYRGSYPTEKNLRFLKRLKLKTIVSLTPKPPLKPFVNFCERYNINSRHFAVSKFKDDVTISAAQVVQLLEMMIDPANLPLYCHCLDGANVTGVIFMCLRKLQNWNLSGIISEFTRFTRGSCIASSESEFVETFKAEIDVPLIIPTWLWQGVRMVKHPTLKLRLVSPNTQSHQQQLQQQQQHHHQQQTPASLSGQAAPLHHQHHTQLGQAAGHIGAAGNNTVPIASSSIPTTTLNSQLINAVAPIQPHAGAPGLVATGASLSQLHAPKTPSLAPSAMPATPGSITPAAGQFPIALSSILTSGSQSSGTGKEKEKDKKKKIEEIKLQFDAGKFNQPVQSRALEALSLERSPIIISINPSNANIPSGSNTSTTSTNWSSAAGSATPTINRTLLQTSSEYAFTNINLMQNLNAN
ncbi:hypothetical protein SAMD00019534_124670, partial [Acytostelium subglobosum LB1]|uniref:hypothetical protein n=1 Tax=Acytostelium subglobosum LB1 TaxID=1410327 RepID=UPI000644D3AF